MKNFRFILLLSLVFVSFLHAQTSASGSPVGSWKWEQNATLTIKADFTVWTDDKPFGTWKWIDESKLAFAIIGPTKRKDTLKLSASGNEISGVNNDGESVSGVREAAK